MGMEGRRYVGWGDNTEQRPKGQIEPPMLPVHREGYTRSCKGPEVGWRVDGRRAVQGKGA